MAKWLSIKILILISVIVLQSSYGKAQQANSTLGFTLSQSEIKITGKELASMYVKIYNKSNTYSEGHLKITSDKRLNLLSKDSTSFKLQVGDSLFVPIKLFIPDKLNSGTDYKIVFSLTDGKGTVEKQTCTLQVASRRKVSLVSQISSIILTNAGDSIRIPVRVVNEGNTSQKVNIIARFPSSLQNGGFHNTKTLTLSAFKDTLIYVNKRVTKDLLQFESFSITLMGIYLNGDAFAQTNIDVQTLKNTRFNNAELLTERYQGFYSDAISLSSQNIGSNFAAYQLSGGSAFDLPYGRIGYNVEATFFNASPSQPYLRNTYISFESHNAGISAGNITRNFDLNLNGRGATAFLIDTARTNSYEAGYVDNASNLIGPGHYIYDTGMSGWGKFEHNGKNLAIKNTVVYNKDPFLLSDNMLSGNEISWITKQNFRLSATINGGTTNEMNNPQNRKNGYLGAFGFDGKIGKLFINSSNTMSSAYYPGLRKGSSIFNERLTYSFPKFSVWVGYSYFNFQPRYLSSYLNYTTMYGSSRSEIGVSKTFNKLSISLSPIFVTETGIFSLSQNESISAKIEAWRLSSQINFLDTKSRQSMYFNFEGGLSKNSFTEGRRFQMKLNGNYRWGMFSLMANYQLGTFFVSETLNNFLHNYGQYTSLNITPTIQKSFFRNSTRVEAGISYNKVSTAGKSWLITGRAEYQMTPQTQLFTSLARTQYNFNQFQYNYNNLQIGINQKLPAKRIGIKHNTLTLFFYRDINPNGIYDTKDSIARNQIVYVDGIAFITDSKGKVSYKNLIEGNHTVTIPGGSKWYMPEKSVLLNRKYMTIALPLSKTGVVRGEISFLFNEMSYEIFKDKSGISLLAANEQGDVFHTKTNDNGLYNFYLPAGDYTIAIDTKELLMELSVPKNFVRIHLDPDKAAKVDFQIKVKDRKIETKKFNSSKEREREREREREKEKEK
ncbi:COG1470 family protein [Pedobacter sp. PWIIR3]